MCLFAGDVVVGDAVVGDVVVGDVVVGDVVVGDVLLEVRLCRETRDNTHTERERGGKDERMGRWILEYELKPRDASLGTLRQPWDRYSRYKYCLIYYCTSTRIPVVKTFHHPIRHNHQRRAEQTQHNTTQHHTTPHPSSVTILPINTTSSQPRL